MEEDKSKRCEMRELTFLEDGGLADFATGVGGRVHHDGLELVKTLFDGSSSPLLSCDVRLSSYLLVDLVCVCVCGGGGGGGGRGERMGVDRQTDSERQRERERER